MIYNYRYRCFCMFLLQGDCLRACRSPVAGLAEERTFSHQSSRVFGHAGQSTHPKARHPWGVLSFEMWRHETSNPRLMYRMSNGYLMGMFKSRADSIPSLFNESLVFWFRFFIEKWPACLNLLTAVWKVFSYLELWHPKIYAGMVSQLISHDYFSHR